MLNNMHKLWNQVKVKVAALCATVKACFASVIAGVKWVKGWCDRIDAWLGYVVPRVAFILLAVAGIGAVIAAMVKLPSLASAWALLGSSFTMVVVAALAFYAARWIHRQHGILVSYGRRKAA